MKRTYWIGFFLLGLNLLIFLNRKQGFDYKAYSSKSELYNSSLFKAWSFEFTEDQLLKASNLLFDSLQIDTCKTDLEKLLSINNFLYSTICENHMFGPLNKKVDEPFALFNELKENKNLTFQCGQAGYLQAFFCAAVGIKTRLIQNIQKPNPNLPPDSHVYNEVWLKEKNQWAISDFYQNRHLIGNENTPITAAGLLDASLEQDSTRFNVYHSESDKIRNRYVIINDPYFSKNYQLAFFKETDPEIVYSWQNKVLHYFFDYSHYKTYDPLADQSNFRHRIKQVVFFSWCIWLTIFITSLIKKQFDRSKKHTKVL